MKSICILVQNHYDSDIRVRRKAEALVTAGYEVDVIALRSERNPAENYLLKGVNVYTVPLRKQRGSRLRYFFEYGSFLVRAGFMLSRLMSRRSYGVVDVNNLPDFLVFAAFWAKWKGAKVLFDMHEITPEFYISKYEIGEKSFTIRALKFIEKRSIRFADHVITINAPIEKLLLTRGLDPKRTTVIMNAVDEAMFASASKRADEDSTRAQTPFVMMYHGTLTKIYGLDIALEAFARANGQMNNAEFWILGGGPERAKLEEMAFRLGIAGRVKFLGSVPPDDIPVWLAKADVGVLPTRRDVFLDLSFSNKLSEYVIMNKAVIVSRLKAIHHYFSEDALGYFEPENPDDLAEKMLRFYGDRSAREKFAANALREYRPIRWEVMKDRYLRLTEQLFAQRNQATAGSHQETVAGVH